MNYYLLDEAWFPVKQCPPGAGVPVTVLGLILSCWRCRVATTAVVGLDPGRGDGFAVATEGFGLKVATMLLGSPLPEGVGEVKRRYSRTAGHSYLSNGCCQCDALLGGFPLRDAALEAVVNEWPGIVRLRRSEIHPTLFEFVDAAGGVAV